MKRWMKLTSILLTLALTFSMYTMPVEAANSIKLNKTSLTLYQGDSINGTYRIKATVKGPLRNIEWSSSNSAVVAVDMAGTVTAMGVGEAVISATANDITATCKVIAKPTRFAVPIKEINLSTKKGYNTTVVKPYVVGKSTSVKWTTSDKTVATVSGGKIVAKKAGSAIITAVANTQTIQIKVNVADQSEVDMQSGIELDTNEIRLNHTGANNSYVLKPCTTAVKNSVKWETSDKTIATVSGGKVVAKKPGTATITATCGNSKATCKVVVVENYIQFMNKVYDVNGLYTNSQRLWLQVSGLSSDVTWKTSNKKVATVENGVVYPVATGKVTISATANGKTAKCTVNIYKPTTTLSSNELEMYLKQGKVVKATLKATAKGGPTSKVVWLSSNENVVKVVNGTLTAIGEGVSYVTASANDVTATCKVTVSNMYMTLDQSSLLLSLDPDENYFQLTATAGGPSKKVTWSVSNKKVATVSTSGFVVAKGYGTAVVTATANGLSATCQVNVEEKSLGFDSIYVMLNMENELRSSYKLSTIITGPAKPVTFTSSDENIARVDATGLIVGVHNGECYIRGTTDDGRMAECLVVVVNGTDYIPEVPSETPETPVTPEDPAEDEEGKDEETEQEPSEEDKNDEDKPDEGEEVEKPGDTDIEKPEETPDENPEGTNPEKPEDTPEENPEEITPAVDPKPLYIARRNINEYTKDNVNELIDFFAAKPVMESNDFFDIEINKFFIIDVDTIDEIKNRATAVVVDLNEVEYEYIGIIVYDKATKIGYFVTDVEVLEGGVMTFEVENNRQCDHEYEVVERTGADGTVYAEHKCKHCDYVGAIRTK